MEKEFKDWQKAAQEEIDKANAPFVIVERERFNTMKKKSNRVFQMFFIGLFLLILLGFLYLAYIGKFQPIVEVSTTPDVVVNEGADNIDIKNYYNHTIETVVTIDNEITEQTT